LAWPRLGGCRDARSPPEGSAITVKLVLAAASPLGLAARSSTSAPHAPTVPEKIRVPAGNHVPARSSARNESLQVQVELRLRDQGACTGPARRAGAVGQVGVLFGARWARSAVPPGSGSRFQGCIRGALDPPRTKSDKSRESLRIGAILRRASAHRETCAEFAPEGAVLWLPEGHPGANDSLLESRPRRLGGVRRGGGGGRGVAVR
jgi:hypothetical protein